MVASRGLEQCDQMQEFSHWGDFRRPLGAFFLSYLLLGTFWEKFLFTGGNFFLELISGWALFC